MEFQQFSAGEGHLSLDLLTVFLFEKGLAQFFRLLLFFLFLSELSLNLIGDERKLSLDF